MLKRRGYPCAELSLPSTLVHPIRVSFNTPPIHRVLIALINSMSTVALKDPLSSFPPDKHLRALRATLPPPTAALLGCPRIFRGGGGGGEEGGREGGREGGSQVEGWRRGWIVLVLDKPDLCLSAWQDAILYDVRWEVRVYNFHVGIWCKKLTFEENVLRVERRRV